MASLRDLAKKAVRYFDPESNEGDNFWNNNNPLLKGLLAGQRAGQKARPRVVSGINNLADDSPAAIAESIGIGMGKAGINFVGGTVNNLARLGERVSGIDTPDKIINTDRLNQILFEDYRVTPRSDFGEGAGQFAFDTMLLTSGANAIKGTKLLKPAQQYLGREAAKRYSIGGLGNRAFAKGIAEVSQSLPYTGMSATRNLLEGGNVGAGFATDIVIDTLIGQFLGKNFGRVNRGNQALVEQFQQALKERNEELLNEAIKIAKEQGYQVDEAMIPQLKAIINQTGSIGGLSAKSFQNLEGDRLTNQLIKKRAFSNVKDKGLRFFISDRQANLKRSGLKEAKDRGFGTLDEIFSHPQFYKEYPQARNITVNFDPKMGANGSYNESANKIILNPNNLNTKTLGTLLHENQHFIQGVEGFARGGSPEQVLADAFEIRNSIVRKLRSVDNPEQRKVLLEELEKADKVAFEGNSFEGYRKLMAEVEARAATDFRGLTQSEGRGRDVLAEQMKKEGIRPEDLILKDAKGISYSENLDFENYLKRGDGASVGKKADNVISDYRKQIGEVSDSKTSLRRGFDSFYTNWVNRFYPIEQLEKRAIKDLDLSIRPEFSPTTATKRLLGAGGTAELRHKSELEPIIDGLGDISKGDFDVFLKAKRDIELGARGIKGSDPKKAREVLDALASKHDVNKMNEVAEQLYTYQRKNLEMLMETGMISEEGFKSITEANQKYVPFERIMDEVDDYLGLPTSKAQQSQQLIKGIKGSERQIKSPLESIIANTYKTEAAVAKNRVAKSIVGLREINPEYKEVITPHKAGSLNKNTISVWEGGKKVIYDVPKEVSDAVKGLNEENVTGVIRILSAPARLLRQQATGRNLDFMLPNVFRDQFDAALNSKYGYKPFLDYFDGLRHLMNYRKTGSDDVVEEWMQSGGRIFFENMSGTKPVDNQISDAINKRFTKRLYDWAVGGIETVGTYSEQPTRIGLYKRAKKATGNPLLAATESREGTLDFARMGAKMKTANSLIPFLNVSVQGFDKMLRTAADNPKAMSLKLALYGGLPATVAAVYNNLYHGQQYARIPDFEKESNLIVVTGTDEEGKPTYLKYPKGHVTQLVMNPVDNFITYMAGNNPQSFGQLALSVFSGAVPILGEGNTPEEVYRRTVGGNMPQFMKPFVEDLANYNFYTGRDVVPFYMEDEPAHKQAFKTTPGAYKLAGTVTGLSPLRIKNFAEGTLAGGIKQPVNLTEVLAGKGDRNKVPILRRFTGSYADFDVDRPEPADKPTLRDRLAEMFPRAFASSGEEVTPLEIPSKPEELKVVYSEALSDIKNYDTRKTRIQYGNYEDDESRQRSMDNLEDDYSFARDIVSKIESEYPEEVFNIQLDAYKSGGRMSVDQRSGWVVEQINSSDNRQKTINKLWEAGVLTTGKSGTAEMVKSRYGIDVSTYTGSDPEIRKRLKPKEEKPKKAKIKRAKKVSVPVRKTPALKIKAAPKISIKSPSLKSGKTKINFAKKKYAKIKPKAIRNTLLKDLTRLG